jgi:hypothetical protein
VPRFAVRRLDEIPTVPDAEVGWYPLQHYFGLKTFGANLFVARETNDELISEHDETGSEQEELYVVLSGSVRFALDGEAHDAQAVSVVAVTEPTVRRSAVALDAGAMLLGLGAPPGEYRSTWRPAWFEHVPKLR